MVFQLLYDARDLDYASDLILEIVGKRFDVSRAYIFENSEDGLASAEAVMNHYRDRAKALCQTVYQATGNMPEFPSTDEEAQG